MRTLQPNGNSLGKAFFKDKCTEWLAHVPVIIRGTRWRGCNAGNSYERHDYLPVTALELGLFPAKRRLERGADRLQREGGRAPAAGPARTE